MAARVTTEAVPIDTVLLDLDGTLTDPKRGITQCIAHALSQMGAKVPSTNDMLFAIGPPLRHSFATLLNTNDTATIERAMALYRERFATIGLFENEVYAGVPDMLATLRSVGLRLILATAKPHVYATRILAHFALDAPLAAVYGPELDGRLQNKSDLLAHLFAIEKLAPSHAVMVGDRAHDIDAAHANGCRAIGVTWGYGGRDELKGANVLCHAPAELAACIRH